MILLFSFIFSIQRTLSHSIFQKSQHGFIPLSNTSDIFYWLFPSQLDKDQDPLIIWLSGGPGCSSSFGLFFENGPYSINQDLNLKENEYSWNQEANLMYIDQPIGTGFSLSSKKEMAKDQQQIAYHFFLFMTKWLEKFSQFQNRDIYITGESYAGKYIASISNFLLKNPIKGLKLKGAAIGNVLVDPYYQFPTTTQYARDNNIIDDKQKKEFDLQYKECLNFIKNGTFSGGINQCYSPVTKIVNTTNINKYDIRLNCDHKPYCYDFSKLEKYFKQQNIINALQVQNRNWTLCNMTVLGELLNDLLKDVRKDFINLLNKNFTILVYSGVKDLGCNYIGQEEWIKNLEWNQSIQFQNEQYREVTLNNVKVGKIKKKGPLSHFIIYDAGHVKFHFFVNIQQMVPMDKPELSLKMINDFINNREILSE